MTRCIGATLIECYCQHHNGNVVTVLINNRQQIDTVELDYDERG